MANKQKQMLAVWGSPGGGKTVTAGGDEQIFGVRTVARYAAVNAYLFERYPLPVIGAHHSK